MQHITKDSKRRYIPGVGLQVLIFGISHFGWITTWCFREHSMELYPGQLACPRYGCKVYKHQLYPVYVVWHNSTYGCPLG